MVDVCAVVGGQYGSEGKGAVVSHLAKEFDHHVRVGAANAGHTLYTGTINHRLEYGGRVVAGFRSAEKHVVQQLPCAAYANPDAELFIGPGALISPGVLFKEIDDNVRWRREQGLPPLELHVDHRAHVIHQGWVEREALSDLADRIGSTSTTAREGIGAAAAARVMREKDCVQAGDFGWPHQVQLEDVPRVLYNRSRILLEGTQGAGLSLVTGQFPYVTSRDTTAAALCAESGVAPGRLERVVLVCRTFPIRVAGNSGPFWSGSREIRWADLDVDDDTERTTVTRKVRRVATFSLEQVAYAAAINGATEVALTFADYLVRRLAGRYGVVDRERLDPEMGLLWDLVGAIEGATAVPVSLIGTGPHSMLELIHDEVEVR